MCARNRRTTRAKELLVSAPVLKASTTLNITRKVVLRPHDDLPALSSGVSVPSVYIEFNDGVRTYLAFEDEDFAVEMWQAEDGTYNTVDDGGRGDEWPASWSEEQVEGVREYASQLHQNVDADAHGVSVDLITGDIAAAILANARGESRSWNDEIPAPVRAVARATKVLDVWVDVADEEPETYVGDAMADLFHYLAKHNVDIDEVIDAARVRFEDEVANPLF